jgi:hypothetical protein
MAATRGVLRQPDDLKCACRSAPATLAGTKMMLKRLIRLRKVRGCVGVGFGKRTPQTLSWP